MELSPDELIYWYAVLAKHDGDYVDELNKIDPKMVDYFVKNGTIIIKTDSDGKNRYRLCGTDMDGDGSLCGPQGEDGTKYLMKYGKE